jgi:hypothetical protein
MSDLALYPERKRTARTAGIFYAVLALAGVPEFIRGGLIVAGDAAQTAQHILGQALVFRLAIFGDLVCQVAFIFLALALYRLFRDVHKEASRIMLALVLVAVPIAMLNTLNEIAALLLIERGEAVQALFFLDLFKNGLLIAEVFWGLWLFPLGWLAFRSGFIPRILGVLLMVGCFGYLALACVGLVFPSGRDLVSPVVTVSAVAELAMVFWLLVFGVRRPRG